MIKYDDENADRSVTGKRLDIYVELVQMLPSQILNAEVHIFPKDVDDNKFYNKSLLDTFIDMEEEELSFVKECFCYLLEPKSLMKIKKENKRIYDILKAILADDGKYRSEYEDQVIPSFILNFKDGDIFIAIIDLFADLEYEDELKGITIYPNKKIVLS